MGRKTWYKHPVHNDFWETKSCVWYLMISLCFFYRIDEKYTLKAGCRRLVYLLFLTNCIWHSGNLNWSERRSNDLFERPWISWLGKASSARADGWLCARDLLMMLVIVDCCYFVLFFSLLTLFLSLISPLLPSFSLSPEFCCLLLLHVFQRYCGSHDGQLQWNITWYIFDIGLRYPDRDLISVIRSNISCCRHSWNQFSSPTSILIEHCSLLLKLISRKSFSSLHCRLRWWPTISDPIV